MSDWDSGDTWGNGPASAAVKDSWNDGAPSNDARNFADNGIFESGAPAGNGFGGDSGEGAGGPRGGCFNCGEDGHMKSDCPNPRVARAFTGTCDTCGKEGHRRSECPEKPKFCQQCKAENDHNTADCPNPMQIDLSHVPDMTAKEAWAMIKEASDEVDIDDFKDAIQILSKASPKTTYVDIEKELRGRGMNLYLIALKKEVAVAYTNVNLQGKINQTHTVGVYRSAACPRPILMEAWPKNADENLDRLADAGVPLERGIPVCSNCGKLGHIRKSCTEESDAPEAVKIKCSLCEEEGHRMRDCTSERPQPRPARTCKFCDSPDHLAKECPDAPQPECRNCYQVGHRRDECTNERVMKCNNCDAIGHIARECTEKKDWTRVTCRHCGEKGHGSEKMCDPEKRDAFQAAKAAEEGVSGVNDGFDNAGGLDNGGNTNGGGDWEGFNNAPASGGNDWEKNAPAISVGGGGGGW